MGWIHQLKSYWQLTQNVPLFDTEVIKLKEGHEDGP